MTKIAFAFPENRIEQFKDLAAEYLTFSGDVSVNFVSTKEALQGFSPEILITNQYDWVFEYFQSSNQIKWIHFMSAGVDKALKEIAKKSVDGLVVTSVSGIHEECIRNYVFSWILSDAQNLLFNYENQKAHAWLRRQSTSLVGKTILIYGFGSIGRSIGKLAKNLGMRVIGVVNQNKSGDDGAETIVYEQIFSYAHQADYIVISAPLTEKTRYSINENFFNQLQAQPLLINISRAEIIDYYALLKALRIGVIKSAVLDVHNTEPLPTDSELWKIANLYLTPHISGYTDNGMRLGIEKLDKLIKLYFSYGIPVNMQVSLAKGY